MKRPTQRHRATVCYTNAPDLARPIGPGGADPCELTRGSKRSAELTSEEIGFLPRCEVSTAVDLVEVGEPGVNRLNPAARGSPDLAGERREADGNFDRRRSL